MHSVNILDVKIKKIASAEEYERVNVLPFGGIDNKRSMIYIGNLCHLIDVVIRFPVKLRMTGVGES